MNATTITIFGITWTVARHRNGTSLHHRNLSIVKDDQGVAHLKNGNGSVATHSSKSECLKVGTEMVLDFYANDFQPMWEE